MTYTATQIEAAAKVMAPHLWPEDERQMSPFVRGQLTFARQDVINRVTEALQAVDDAATVEKYGNWPPPPDQERTGSFEIPEDAAMIEQTLVTFTYIDREGKTAYGVRTSGEGLLTTWLGMADLAKHFLLQQQLTGGWQIRNNENGE